MFRTSKGNENVAPKIRYFEISGAKLQQLAKQGKRRLVRIIGRFEKLRVREIGIPPYLYRCDSDKWLSDVNSIQLNFQFIIFTGTKEAMISRIFQFITNILTK